MGWKHSSQCPHVAGPISGLAHAHPRPPRDPQPHAPHHRVRRRPHSLSITDKSGMTQTAMLHSHLNSSAPRGPNSKVYGINGCPLAVAARTECVCSWSSPVPAGLLYWNCCSGSANRLKEQAQVIHAITQHGQTIRAQTKGKANVPAQGSRPKLRTTGAPARRPHFQPAPFSGPDEKAMSTSAEGLVKGKRTRAETDVQIVGFGRRC